MYVEWKKGVAWLKSLANFFNFLYLIADVDIKIQREK